MEFFRIHLSTKTYLKKYLHHVYGNPLFLNQANEFGDMIITKLSSNLNCNLDRHDIDRRLNRLSDKLTIYIPMCYHSKLETDLTEHQVVRINRYFENLFERELHHVVEHAHTFLNVQRQQAIEVFASVYGIELDKDISFEAMKKAEFRYREKLKKKSGTVAANCIFNLLATNDKRMFPKKKNRATQDPV